MKTLNTLNKSILISLLTLLSGVTVTSAQAKSNVIDIDFDAPEQTNEVAFVAFSRDSRIASIVNNDLSRTELKVANARQVNFPSQPKDSSELSGSLTRWQQTGIPYLVVGDTRSKRGKVVIEFEVIDLQSGSVVQGKQSVSSDADSNSLRYAAHVVSDKIYEIITGKPGDFSGRIAFVEESGFGSSKVSTLKVMDADTKNPVGRVRVTGSIFSPAWSPDGRKLAYAVQRPKGRPVIYIQNVDGPNRDPQLLTPFYGNNLSPSFSPDGNYILFSGSHQGNADIYRIPVTGGNPERLISSPSLEITPSYAPDGRSFIYASDKLGENKPRIYRYNFSSKQSSPVSRGGYATNPSFSPDGSRIAFLNGSNASIMSTSGQVLMNFSTGNADEAPSFSPNGNRVVYATRSGNQGMITIRSLNGGSTFSKTFNGRVLSPVWSKSPK